MMSRLGLTGRLSVWSARRRWLVIAAWLAFAVGITVVGSLVGSRLTTDISFSNKPESQLARELLEEARGSEPYVEQVIIQSDRYTVDDPEFAAFVTELQRAVRGLRGVVEPNQVHSYFQIGEPSLVSADRTTTIMPTLLVGELDRATENVAALEATLHEFDGRDGFRVLTGGYASVNRAFTEAAEADRAPSSRYCRSRSSS